MKFAQHVNEHQQVGIFGGQWDDLRFPANGVSIGSLSTPPDVDTDTGLLLFDGNSTNETIAILAQMPHRKKLGSPLKPHIHWRKTTDAAGGVRWTLRYKWFNNGEVEPAWSSLITGTLVSALDPGATQQSTITEFGEIAAPADESLSSMFLCQLGRTPGHASDTYNGADCLLFEFDLHFQADSIGSRQEYQK